MSSAELLVKLQGLLSGSGFASTFFKGASSCVGLDIGSHSLKGVKLLKTPEGLSLTNLSLSPLLPQADTDQKRAALKQLLGSLDAGKAPVVTAVGGPGTVLRSVLLPKMTPQELKTSLAFEAEKFIPFKLEEVFLDSVILGDKPGNRMEVLLAAARKDLVNEHLELLAGGGITPAVVDLEAVALANAWEVGHGGAATQTVALLYVDSRRTTLDFFVENRLEFTREIPMAGERFTQTVAETLRVDPAQAQRLQWNSGPRAEEVKTALQPAWEEWLTQCRVSFDFYGNQFGHGVEQLAIGGGCADLPGFSEWVAQATGLPTQVWDPLQGIATSLDPDLLKKNRHALGVALGLAVRGISR